jgi:hypothetical protein
LKIKDYNLKLSRVLIIIVIAIVLSVGITKALTTQPFTVSMGIYPAAPSFTVWDQDGTLYAKNSFGVIAYTGTNASNLIQQCLDNGNKTLVTSGFYTIDAPITLNAWNWLEGDGGTYFHLDTNVNDYMFKFDSDSHDVRLKNFRCYGNGASQSGSEDSNGIIFASSLTYDVWITDCAFYTWKGCAVNFTGVNHFYIDRCIFDSYGTGAVRGKTAIFLSGTTEAHISNIVFERVETGIHSMNGDRIVMSDITGTHGDFTTGADNAIYFQSTHNIEVNNVVLKYWEGSGVTLTGVENVTLNNVFSKYCVTDSVLIYNTNYTVASNFQLGNSDTGLYLGGVCLHNTFVNVLSYENTQQGVYESAISDYNIYNNIDTYFNGAPGISTQGTNTHTVNSWNSTSWVT